MTSCDWTEIQNIPENTVINQDLSVPLFYKAYSFKPLTIDDTCRVHGLNDNFFYNGFEYPAVFLRLSPIYLPIDLNFSDNSSYIIKKLNLIIENRFPVKASFQIQFYDGAGIYYDETPIIDVADIATFNLPVEEIALKKLTSINLLITTTIQNQNTPAPIQLTDNNNIIVNIAARIQSERNIKDMPK